MAKRKKYPKLPNGFGSIKYLGKNRRNPYGVYPPCQEFTLEDVPVTRKALCCVDDWMKGFAVLTAYQAGTYTPGVERELEMSFGKALELIVSLMHQMYAYAMIYELVDKDYSAAVKIKIQDDDEHGEPFTEDDLKILWAHHEDPIVEMLIIMCYSGCRIAAYKMLDVNLEDRYFQGGVKTAAGKNHIVPIHSAILPLVERRLKDDGALMRSTTKNYCSTWIQSPQQQNCWKTKKKRRYWKIWQTWLTLGKSMKQKTNYGI